MFTLNESNFEQEVLQETEKPVVVDFWAQYCAPCRILMPILSQIENELGPKAKIGKVNIQYEQELAQRWNIRSIPTVLIFKDGEVVDQFIGLRSKEYIVERLQSIV